MPVVLNAANEVAVEAFLQERIGFTAIADVIAAAMAAHTVAPAATLAAVRAVDGWAREYSRGLVNTRAAETLRISS
jgi:1-deoxy-D-xylulose-5-phosphate reductoisomerase